MNGHKKYTRPPKWKFGKWVHEEREYCNHWPNKHQLRDRICIHVDWKILLWDQVRFLFRRSAKPIRRD